MQKTYTQSAIVRNVPNTSGMGKTLLSIFRNCIESTLKGIKGAVIFQNDVLVYGTTQQLFDKEMLEVKSWLREKDLIFSEKKSNTKPVNTVSLSGYYISKE